MNYRVYAHGIGRTTWDRFYEEQIKQFDTICKSGSLLSLRKQNKESHGNFAGLDYISLCDLEKRKIFNDKIMPACETNPRLNSFLQALGEKYKVPKNYNAYETYIKSSLSFLFPKDDVDAINTKLVEIFIRNARGFDLMRACGESEDERFSDYPDEVQVKDSLSLEKMNGILFPTERYIDYLGRAKQISKIKTLQHEIKGIKRILEQYGYDVPIYDSITFNEMNDEYSENVILSRK